jgi:hypothetical protein
MFINDEPDVHGSVYLVDCLWELYVLVGKNARGKRLDIRVAIKAAEVGLHILSPGQ